MTEYNQYEDGYSVGWQEGRRIGVEEGYMEASVQYEQRMSALWAELQTLNARLDYLENLVTMPMDFDEEGL